MFKVCKAKFDNIEHFDFTVCHQVFVANPSKAKPILDILLKNKDKLIDFLSKFHTDRTGGSANLHLMQINFVHFSQRMSSLMMKKPT